MSNHTPGPWEIDSDGEGKPFAIVTSTNRPDIDDDVCEVYGGNDDNELVRQANAKLIAAAPDLLAALEACVGLLAEDESHMMPAEHTLIDNARAAIAKAELLSAPAGWDRIEAD